MNISKKYLSSYNLNIETKEIPHWDPWNTLNNSNILYEIYSNHYFILGPKIGEKKYIWLFKIISSNNEIYIISLQTNENNPCIDIVIKQVTNTGYIKSINKSDEYNGNYLMNWILQIFGAFNIKSCILIDQAYKNCINRNMTTYISLSLISILRGNRTYYEKYGFKPYNSVNNKLVNNGRTSKLKNLHNELLKITWEEFKDIQSIYVNRIRDKYGLVYRKFPYLIFQEFNETDCKIFYDWISDIILNKYPGHILLQEIQTLISKSIWERKII